jgi:hypothetical protein
MLALLLSTAAASTPWEEEFVTDWTPELWSAAVAELPPAVLELEALAEADLSGIEAQLDAAIDEGELEVGFAGLDTSWAEVTTAWDRADGWSYQASDIEKLGPDALSPEDFETLSSAYFDADMLLPELADYRLDLGMLYFRALENTPEMTGTRTRLAGELLVFWGEGYSDREGEDCDAIEVLLNAHLVVASAVSGAEYALEVCTDHPGALEAANTYIGGGSEGGIVMYNGDDEYAYTTEDLEKQARRGRFNVKSGTTYGYFPASSGHQLGTRVVASFSNEAGHLWVYGGGGYVRGLKSKSNGYEGFVGVKLATSSASRWRRPSPGTATERTVPPTGTSRPVRAWWFLPSSLSQSGSWPSACTRTRASAWTPLARTPTCPSRTS